MKKYTSPNAVVVELSTHDDILNGSGNKTLSDMLDKTNNLDIQDSADW